MKAAGEAASLPDQLAEIAARLTDVADAVATEAEAAVQLVRMMTTQAHDVAELSAGLVTAADEIESNVRQQGEALGAAATALSTNRPALDALAGSVENVSAIAAAIGRIARESRILSLNARIEASRGGDAGRGFSAVAMEMSTMSDRTRLATDDIAERASVIARNVDAASAIMSSHDAIVSSQNDIVESALESAARQREAAATLASITADTAATIDRAAAAVGRVGANAVAVRLLARQIGRLAR
ncbi:methyl-accepting chemotaxis protein [Sphingomonas jejuensis]|uniref:Methyl-accepting chemotaxis protein n=1 Tax=Sphingomonas jejuensis TaxID=904715 RepID=A0ABX0XNW8_9SPHN|nr:methyl-accepting chemotaxis protein [Sphingomonas jejuensis]NJC35082.1 methyl-accepting chemotaxis protein [Sphingomonas jejuensis]